MKSLLTISLCCCALLATSSAMRVPQAAPVHPVPDHPAAVLSESERSATPRSVLSESEWRATPRSALMLVALKEVGTVEVTGQNDGPRVEEYLKSVGLEKGQPYCAAFVFWCGREALGLGNPFPRSGYSPDMVGGATVSAALARPGDAFGIYIPSKGRIGHTGLVLKLQGALVRTVEANTSYDAATGTPQDANGDGVHSKLRPLRTLRAVKSWLP